MAVYKIGDVCVRVRVCLCAWRARMCVCVWGGGGGGRLAMVPRLVPCMSPPACRQCSWTRPGCGHTCSTCSKACLPASRHLPTWKPCTSCSSRWRCRLMAARTQQAAAEAAATGALVAAGGGRAPCQAAAQSSHRLVQLPAEMLGPPPPAPGTRRRRRSRQQHRQVSRRSRHPSCLATSSMAQAPGSGRRCHRTMFCSSLRVGPWCGWLQRPCKR